jgi:DNA-directed RNA polymerase subunit D
VETHHKIEMDVEIAERGGTEVKFILSGVKVRFANALRRTMIADVAKLAIDEVNILENTSLLYDEQLVLRLGLIPLRTKRHEFVPEDRISLTLEAISPERDGYTVVYSKELISSDPTVEPAYGNIPLVKLISSEREVGGLKSVARQRIALEAFARLGCGREHAKWQAVTACSYQELVEGDHKGALLFAVESDGALPVDEIIGEAANLMHAKCEHVLAGLTAIC